MSRSSSATHSSQVASVPSSASDSHGSPTALLEIIRTLGLSRRPRVHLERALEILMTDLGATAVTLVLHDSDTGDFEVEASVGDVRADLERTDHLRRLVAETGRSSIVPRLDGEHTFISVAVLTEGRPVGALSVDLPFRPERSYERDTATLEVAAMMCSQALRITQLVEDARRTKQLAPPADERQDDRSVDAAYLLGGGEPARRLLRAIEHAALHQDAVLIRGEPGTWKELVARSIHQRSGSRSGPFVTVGCSTLPEALVATRLFGDGALSRARGATSPLAVDLARHGTLYLEGAGRLTEPLQAKLVAELGDWTATRLVASADAPLEHLVDTGLLRQDLYYRLSRHVIVVPPLRERRPDIPLLAECLVEQHALERGKNIRRISETAVEMLMGHRWPGNVQELAGAIEHAVRVCDDQVLRSHHLPLTIQTAETTDTSPGESLADAVARCERDLIEDALRSTRGNRVQAARMLQSTERIVSYKVKKYRIDCRRFR